MGNKYGSKRRPTRKTQIKKFKKMMHEGMTSLRGLSKVPRSTEIPPRRPLKMHLVRRSNDSVHWFMNELTSRIVGESGRPSDRYHLGKIILQSLKDAPDFICQIDGGTDEFETNLSVLERTVRCATAMKNYGLQCGDVIVLMAPNHVDLCIPFYASLCLGVAVNAVDAKFTINELYSAYNPVRPKIIFCQSEKAPEVQTALNMVELAAEIITFDKGDYLVGFPEFLEKYAEDFSVDEFKAADFNAEETFAFLIATSGTTGDPKAAAVTHKNFAVATPYVWLKSWKFPSPVGMMVLLSPLQWLTAIVNFTITPIFRYTRLQTSSELTMDHVANLFNTYKPNFTVASPTFFSNLLQYKEREIDFTCLDILMLGGSAVPTDLIEQIKQISPNIEIIDAYGMTELSGLAFTTDDTPLGSCGKPMGCLQYRLIDLETQKDITEPNIPGELWVKGPGIFKEYYKNPEATENVFAEDGWFKTGDMFYRDENWNFYFVERIKLMLKYRSYHISPVELENVIRGHAGVSDVAVTGVPSSDGDLAVACVVTRPGAQVTAQHIKELVKNTLSDSKQLRGGVIFMDQLPLTASTKIHRKKLKEMVQQLKRE